MKKNVFKITPCKLLATFSCYLYPAICIFFLISLSGCYTPSYNLEIGGIDSLYSTLSKSEGDLNKIDTIKLNKQNKEFISNMNIMGVIMQKSNDSYAKEIFGDYESLGNSFFKIYRRQFLDLISEISHSKNQLDSLKHDLTNGLMPKSSFDIYFRREKNSIKTLVQNINLYIGYSKGYSKKFESLNPKIIKMKENIK